MVGRNGHSAGAKDRVSGKGACGGSGWNEVQGVGVEQNLRGKEAVASWCKGAGGTRVEQNLRDAQGNVEG